MTGQDHEQDFFFKSYFFPLTTPKVIHFIIIIGLIAFCSGLFNNFVKDDHGQIIENPTVQSIRNLPYFFTGGVFYNGGVSNLVGAYYKPLLSTYFSVIYSTSGANYFVFHLFQMLLFIANACILFLLFKQFFRISIAFILALIFLIHPINSEAAFYISASQEVLFFFFGILSLWLLIGYHSQKVLILISLSLFLAILSKETGILFFFVSLLYISLFKRKNFFPLLGYALSFLFIYFILRISAIGIVTQTTASAPIQSVNLWTRIINIPSIFLFYLKTFIFPLDLSSSYHWVITRIDFGHFWFPLIIDCIFLIIIFLIAVGFYMHFSRKYFKLYILFSTWFLLGMVFHLQILPLDFTVADRWFYFPMVGILGIIGLIFEAIHINFRNKWVISTTLIVLILLSIRTFERGFDWKNDLTIASHDIKISKEAYDLESELSFAYYNEGKLEQSKDHAEKSVRLYPFIINYGNLGGAYYYLGNYKKANESFLKALQYGDYYKTYENLAGLALSYGEPHKNINFIKKIALKKYPQDAKLWLRLAQLEYTYGDKDNAKIDIQQAYVYDQGPEISTAYKIIMKYNP